MLILYNTLTKKKSKFTPIKPGIVRMYSCGPTVYDYAHIGNFRAYIASDLLKRYLLYKGYKVFHVMNITDVDDKTIARSRKEKISLKELTDRYAKAFFEDLAKLNIVFPDVFPRATEHIEDMVKLIKKLLKKGYAYKAEDGSIYYNISKFPRYGRLAGIDIELLKAGASGRIKLDQYEKKQIHDFALWKAWTPEDGDVFWETDIGKGRPGWHIECSAMSMKHLGETFDIHTGGIDLIFPHHENEIAQSEAATGKPFVRYWFHNEFLLVEGRKMSKSLGNFYTLRDILSKGYDPKAIRWLLLTTHYRKKLNFTFKELEAAKKTVDGLIDFYARLLELSKKGKLGKRSTEQNAAEAIIKETQELFETAMDNDLDISSALAAIFSAVKKINKLIAQGRLGKEEALKVAKQFKRFDSVLGILEERKTRLSKEEKELIRRREEARKKKNWAEADRIREQLRKLGILIEDTPTGPRIKRID